MPKTTVPRILILGGGFAGAYCAYYLEKKFQRNEAEGDCAVNVDPEGKSYPATAQHAIQEARALARNLKLVLQGRRTEPCVIKSKGALAALGCRTGVAKVFGFKVSGFLAWWLWRTVYLLRMPTLARKIRVALDWTTLLFFSRDFVQLGLTDSRSRTGTGDERS